MKPYRGYDWRRRALDLLSDDVVVFGVVALIFGGILTWGLASRGGDPEGELLALKASGANPELRPPPVESVLPAKPRKAVSGLDLAPRLAQLGKNAAAEESLSDAAGTGKGKVPAAVPGSAQKPAGAGAGAAQAAKAASLPRVSGLAESNKGVIQGAGANAAAAAGAAARRFAPPEALGAGEAATEEGGLLAQMGRIASRLRRAAGFPAGALLGGLNPAGKNLSAFPAGAKRLDTVSAISGGDAANVDRASVSSGEGDRPARGGGLLGGGPSGLKPPPEAGEGACVGDACPEGHGGAEAEGEAGAQEAGAHHEGEPPCFVTGDTRCTVYTCGVAGSVAAAADFDAAYGPVVAAQRALLSEVQADVQNLIAQEQTILASAQGQRFDCTGCEAANQCVARGVQRVTQIVRRLQQESAQLQAALACAPGPSPDSGGCHGAALEAIAIERAIVNEDFQEHIRQTEMKQDCTQSIRTETQQWRTRPDGTSYQVTVPDPQGVAEKRRFEEFADWENNAQKQLLKSIAKPWCDRHGCRGGLADIAQLRKRIHDESEAYSVFSGDIPDVYSEMRGADALLAQAESLLADPGGAESRNLFLGSQRMAEAQQRLMRSRELWESKQRSACR